MILKILNVPNKLLKKKSDLVVESNEELKNIVNDMIETMYDAKGIGLSGVQVGILRRIVVIDVAQRNEDKKDPLVFINPEIIWKSSEKELMEEGCLSVPGERENVMRHLSVEVKYQDINLKNHKIKAEGLLSHALQHEIDHTNGVVFLDYLSKLKRDFIINKQKKNNI
ncbi:MAG: peptide deformylase [Rickettsiales bacterium]|jgi:peptide deformylase|nr:peptide deformylase [Rickettsiales bacterium]